MRKIGRCWTTWIRIRLRARIVLNLIRYHEVCTDTLTNARIKGHRTDGLYRHFLMVRATGKPTLSSIVCCPWGISAVRSVGIDVRRWIRIVLLLPRPNLAWHLEG